MTEFISHQQTSLARFSDVSRIRASWRSYITIDQPLQQKRQSKINYVNLICLLLEGDFC